MKLEVYTITQSITTKIIEIHIIDTLYSHLHNDLKIISQQNTISGKLYLLDLLQNNK